MFRMGASKSFDIFLQMFKTRAWERLRSIFPATGAKLPHPTGPQLPRLAVLSSRIYFRLFDKHFQMFISRNPTSVILHLQQMKFLLGCVGEVDEADQV